jgi:hypothetical protein
LSTGERTRRELIELEPYRQAAAEFLARAIGDEGEDSTIPARRMSLIVYRARIHQRILQIDAALERRGIVDRHGNLRERWLQRFESLVNTAKVIDSTLGLETGSRAGDTPGVVTVRFGGRFRPIESEEPGQDEGRGQ